MVVEREPEFAADEFRDEVHQKVVVVGVDGSKLSSKALTWAAQEARWRSAVLKVVHAWSVPALAYGSFMDADSTAEIAAEADVEIDAQIAEVLGAYPDVTIQKEVAEGAAAQVILDASEDADLVVVGSRGRGGFTGLMLGSVSLQVAHHAHCPVTIVRP